MYTCARFHADSVANGLMCGQVARASHWTDAFQEALVPSTMGSVENTASW